MKTAGDILSALFDEQFVKKAKTYSKFFDSWKDITEKNGLAAAADHSRIKDLDRGILLIEIDHPGWKQILQTKQTKFLNDFRLRFPELDITGISLMLGSGKSQEGEVAREAGAAREPAQEPAPTREPPSSPSAVAPTAEPVEAVEEPPPAVTGLDAIKDEEFREKLIRIGKNIAAGEKKY